MNISIDAGHNASPDIGATGIKQEDVLTKELAGLIVTRLRTLGHSVTDCTPYGNTFVNVAQSLKYRVDRANASKSQFHLCLHFNAGGGHGTEAYISSAIGRDYGTKLCDQISKLGYLNRGIKDGSGLYVVKNTNMPCVLLEVAFLDSADDMGRYKADLVANSIVRAITDQSEKDSVPVVVVPDERIFDITIPVASNITPFNGGTGYIEALDNRLIIHLDRYTYISMINEGQESHIDVFTRKESKRLI